MVFGVWCTARWLPTLRKHWMKTMESGWPTNTTHKELVLYWESCIDILTRAPNEQVAGTMFSFGADPTETETTQFRSRVAFFGWPTTPRPPKSTQTYTTKTGSLVYSSRLGPNKTSHDHTGVEFASKTQMRDFLI